jgi:hypothetical protein
MGAVQLGGMTLSTLFTLVLVPTVFSLWIDTRAGLARLFRRTPVLAEPLTTPIELVEEREEVGD